MVSIRNSTFGDCFFLPFFSGGLSKVFWPIPQRFFLPNCLGLLDPPPPNPLMLSLPRGSPPFHLPPFFLCPFSGLKVGQLKCTFFPFLSFLILLTTPPPLSFPPLPFLRGFFREGPGCFRVVVLVSFFSLYCCSPPRAGMLRVRSLPTEGTP